MKFNNIHILNNWEYWPSFMFYVPIVPYACFLALKAQSLVYFSATNPAIKHSGNGSESKFQTLHLIPTEYRPKTVFIKNGTPFSQSLKKIEMSEISYPMIVKPDIGFRGLLVQKIDNEKELMRYCNRYEGLNLLVQEYITYSNECGILYYRLPNKKKGTISSLTLKKYLSVTGNGKSTILDLIRSHPRGKRYESYLESTIGDQFKQVLKNKEKRILTTIGNHSKGTQFINGNDLIDSELVSFFDLLFEKIPGLYYGRLDLKYETMDSLKQGKDFKILEINGIVSEPTHIYDPINSSYFGALKAIRNHWKIMYHIAVQNHKKNKVPYDKAGDFVGSLFEIKKHKKQIKSLT